MGWNDRLDDNSFNLIVICSKCGKQFKAYKIEQIPGFRDKEEMVCPYCKHICRTSMEYEFMTQKMEE